MVRQETKVLRGILNLVPPSSLTIPELPVSFLPGADGFEWLQVFSKSLHVRHTLGTVALGDGIH
jgi:hypothetical protein